MDHIPVFEKFNQNLLVEETFNILDGKVSKEELNVIIGEGLFSWIGGLFSNPKKKRKLDKLGEDLFKVKVELQKLEIQENELDRFKDDLKVGSEEYKAADRKAGILDKAKSAKIGALRKKEEVILQKMDDLAGDSQKLSKYVNKVKLEIRMRANDATIQLADDEMKRVLTKLKQKDAKDVKDLDQQIAQAA
tara:strand:- start:63 stop:635 length:573 start_codon:yes stop_codon:yes gene_type:complete